MTKSNRNASSASNDLETKITVQVNEALDKAVTSPTFLRSLASVLTELVAKQLEESMNFNSDLVAGLEKKLAERDREISNLKSQLEEKTDQLEMYSRRNCLRIFGVEETENEDTDRLVIEKVANKISVNLSLQDIDRSHRVGRQVTGKNRPIIVKFVSYRKRNEMFRSKRLLKQTGMTIREDLTKSRLVLLQAAIDRFSLRNVWTEDGTIVIKHGNGRSRVQTRAQLEAISCLA